MNMVETCHKCGVPLSISGQFAWEDNGVITVAGARHDRNVLYESNIIDHVLLGIERLIGMPIRHIAIESRRREVRRYIEKAMGDITEIFRREGGPAGEEERQIAREAALTIFEVGGSLGYGISRLSEGWDGDDDYPWRESIIINPYSLSFRLGEVLGGTEALEGRDMAIEWEQVADNTYRIRCSPAARPPGLKGRLKRRRYEFKPGALSFERCDICGVPLGVAHYKWELAEGIITDPDNGWRMALYPPAALEAVLLDLEAELGESIPDIIIQAQKAYVKSRAAGENWVHGGGTFGQLVALRGLGNLTRFEADLNHLSLKIENSCLQPLMVGMAQALFELALNKEKTNYEWDLAGDGDLEIIISC